MELEARLIDDLLDVTRIAKGKLQLSLETVSVHEILQRAYEICREDILREKPAHRVPPAGRAATTSRPIRRACSRSFGT